MPGKKSKPTPRKEYRWSMHPALHDKVSRLLEDDNLFFAFHDVDDSVGCTKEFDTNIMGRFVCRNNGCTSNGWSSKKIAMTIRMYNGEMYNARVYHQRCQSCNRLSRPSLDGSYAERIAYRLRKWSGIEVEAPTYSGESKGPHESHLCEGCKAGHCREMNREQSFY